MLSLGCARPPLPLATETAGRLQARQRVIDRLVEASVKVALERAGRRVLVASGIVIAARPADATHPAVSYILTAAHVLTGGEDATIFVGFCGPNAARGKFAATVLSQGAPETLDLALLRVPGIAVPPVTVMAAAPVRLGTPILVVGFPEGQRLGISGGIVSQLPLAAVQNGIPADRADQRLVIDAAAPRGVSGGGVFAAATGQLVGIVQGHQTFAIAVQDPAHPYTLKVPIPGATFVVPWAQIQPFLTSPAVAPELSPLLPVTAHALPGLPQ